MTKAQQTRMPGEWKRERRYAKSSIFSLPILTDIQKMFRIESCILQSLTKHGDKSGCWGEEKKDRKS